MSNPKKIITLEMMEEEGVGSGLTQSMIDDYVDSLEAHIAYVQEACRNVLSLPEEQVRAHDLSKWSMYEFPQYVRQFKGPANDPDGFSYAWLHHIHHNPHHWQHWIFSDGFHPKGSKVIGGRVPMPPQYVAEMIGDWMGASKAYTGSWDMSDWLMKNLPSIKLHPDTSLYLEKLLTSGALDYAHVYAELRARNAY